LQVGEERADVLRGGDQLEPPRLRFQCLERFENVALPLRAEPAQGADAPIEGGAMQLLEGIDAELLVQQRYPLQAEPGDPEEHGQGFGDLRVQFLEEGGTAGRSEFGDLAGEVGADAG
jgi:hypothetical protein